MAALLYLVLTFVSMVTVSEGNLQYLYFSGPGGAAYGDLPGFYGAAATYTNNASALDYPDSGVQCLNTQKGIKEGFDLKSISMDPRSRKVLLSLKHEFEISVTLATMTLCLPQEECGNATYSPDILFDNAQLDDVMSPVAYYDSTVYFLTTIDTEIPGGLTKRTVELRMLQGCQEKYPVNVYTSFYIADCSKLIVQLDEVEYDEENSMSPLTVSNSLYIINTGSESFFLTQLQRMVYDEDVVAQTYSMELILVKNSTKEVVSLHEEKVDTKFRRYELEHLGAINLRNNKLCWSAVDTILCADWSNSGSISNIVTVLPKGESSKACLIMPGDEMARKLVTGIAVAKTEGEFAIYFGCLSQTSGYGGTGLIRMANGKRSIYSLEVNQTDIFAGSMFLVSDCKPEQVIPSVEGGGYGGYGVSGASNLPISLFTFLVLFLLVRL